jgi:nucleoside-diphosphate-sugar epimerase
MLNTGSIFIAGASRGVGREIATILIAQGYNVVALVRTADAEAELERLGAKVVIGDALNYTDLDRAILTNLPIAAMISTIGGMSVDGQRADYVGNKNLIDAAKAAGISRFLLVSSLGAGATKDAIPPQAYQSLAAVLADKERAEQHLVESGLIYTIIRPGGLKSAPATGNGVLTISTNVAGSIHRADVATLVCGCLNGTSADNLILSAFDRQMTYGDIQYQEFIPS